MSTAYQDIRSDLKTGDLVLFSGKGHISHGIKWITNSQWSHIGMVLRMEVRDQKMILLWESTTLSNIQDVLDGKEKKGVQLVPLGQRLNTYDGGAALRQLNLNITDQQFADLLKFRETVRNKPYERDKIELIKSAYDGPFGKNVEDLSSLFCSELVAEAYQNMKLLDERLPSNEYTPKDFSTHPKAEAEDHLINGAGLGDEIEIYYDKNRSVNI